MFFGAWYTDWYGTWFDGQQVAGNELEASIGGSSAINATLTAVTVGGSGDAGGDWIRHLFNEHVRKLEQQRRRKLRDRKQEEELIVCGGL